VTEQQPFSTAKPVNEMNLVEIAEQLEKVTSWIEAQRVKEREARVIYQSVAQQVEGAVQQIRHYAQQLVDAQHRKVSSFSGMLTKEQTQSLQARSSRPASIPSHNGRGKMNIADAILSIWSLDRFHEALTTEEIGEALPETGYKSNAAPTSLKSSINQALAKLCRSGQVIRFRSDGTRIPARDNKSRARKYISANLAGEE
jgi:YesN/AraC family two-component response regulator